MTLCAEVQDVIERTYQPAGVRIEDCLISRHRSRELSLATSISRDLSKDACTFLRYFQDRLHIGVYLSPGIVAALEDEHPHASISHRNIRPLITFIEEINHGVHAAIAFQQGFRSINSESFACALEVQSKVDTYWLLRRFLFLLTASTATKEMKQWIHDRIFKDERFNYASPTLQRRYQLAHRIAEKFVHRTEREAPANRVKLLRKFRRANLARKYLLGTLPRSS